MATTVLFKSPDGKRITSFTDQDLVEKAMKLGADQTITLNGNCYRIVTAQAGVTPSKGLGKKKSITTLEFTVIPKPP